ncbi:MAG: ferredoxin [Bryobacterales bacterium]|nr:ferredoxin [Bryobacterales bacterium]
MSMTPAVLGPMEQAGLLESEFPLYLPAHGEPPRRLVDVLMGSMPNPATFPLLTPRLSQVAKAFEDAVAPGGTPMGAAREKALASLTDRLQLTPAEWQQFDKELLRFAKLLPREGIVLPYHASALPVLHGALLRSVRKAARERFVHEVEKVSRRLHNLLTVDESHRPGASTAETLAASLGVDGNRYFQPEAMAQALGRPAKGSNLLDGARRARIQVAIETLDRWLADVTQAPQYWVFSAGAAPEGIEAVGGKHRQEADSFQAAYDCCGHLLNSLGRLLSALRVAQLECEGAYDPALHSQHLQRIDWQSATVEQLCALPGVVVLETAQRLGNASLAGFSRVLRSGRPVHVLITTAGIVAEDGLGAFPTDPGYLSVAHRGAFVLQSSLTRTSHLLDGLREMASTFLPAVAVVAVPLANGSRRAWLANELAVACRAVPLFRYLPENGHTWAGRLAIEDARVDALSFDVPKGSRETVTAAHAAAMDLPSHLRLVPDEYHDRELIPLDEYLARYESQPPLAIPYLWLNGEGGKACRAALTRELVTYCRERAQAWRMLQELAGVHNQHVEAAIASTREALAGEAERRERAVADQARREASAQTVQRLVAALMDPKSVRVNRAPVASLAIPLPAPAVLAPSAAPQPAPAAAPPAPAQADVPADPYIDSFLCTSCNDCVKINSRMFLYNAEKQAYIGDVSAGTYAELVKAAEGCPAKCIHPGLPRNGDTTATPALIAKAAKFR